ncbi:MAG: hypothetical protein ABEJ42_00570 [Halobacteriaceae archaeon]
MPRRTPTEPAAGAENPDVPEEVEETRPARRRERPSRRYQVVEGAVNLVLFALTIALLAGTGIAAAMADTVLGGALVLALVVLVVVASMYLQTASATVADFVVDEENQTVVQDAADEPGDGSGDGATTDAAGRSADGGERRRGDR